MGSTTKIYERLDEIYRLSQNVCQASAKKNPSVKPGNRILFTIADIIFIQVRSGTNTGIQVVGSIYKWEMGWNPQCVPKYLTDQDQEEYSIKSGNRTLFKIMTAEIIFMQSAS